MCDAHLSTSKQAFQSCSLCSFPLVGDASGEDKTGIDKGSHAPVAKLLLLLYSFRKTATDSKGCNRFKLHNEYIPNIRHYRGIESRRYFKLP